MDWIYDTDAFNPDVYRDEENYPKIPPIDKKELGFCSDLIANMTCRGATEKELSDAIKYSMVIIDAKKNKLNWTKAKKEFNIPEYAIKYMSEDLKPWQEEIMENDISKDDPVNHPSHYTDGNIEVIDFIEDKHLGFHLGNAVKYIARAGKKDPNKMVEDLEKARWYLDREIERLKKMDDILPEGSIVTKRNESGEPIVGRYPYNAKVWRDIYNSYNGEPD